jgi:ferritin-like metal-binding protein YciE
MEVIFSIKQSLLKWRNMETTNSEQSFIQDIQALWTAEKMLTEAMPLMVEKASHLGLQKNLALHLAETRQHKAALALILKQMGLTADEQYINADMQAILDKDRKQCRPLQKA